MMTGRRKLASNDNEDELQSALEHELGLADVRDHGGDVGANDEEMWQNGVDAMQVLLPAPFAEDFIVQLFVVIAMSPLDIHTFLSRGSTI